MMQRVFVRVVGFNNTERHALNTIFRLSQDKQSAREWSYEPWQLGSPAAPRLALIDGASPEAAEVLQEIERLGGIGIIWVGSISPAKAWSSFLRPLQWSQVLVSMDQYFSPDSGLDVDFGGETWPSVLESTGSHLFPEHDLRRVLLADGDESARKYWTGKFASMGIVHVDEAAQAPQAQEFLSPERMQRMTYDIVVIDLDVPGGDPWKLLAQAGNVRLKLITQNGLSFGNRMSAKVNGAVALAKPLNSARIDELLQKIQ
jgi:CheY-like chemotaxis protein